jgi:hypothetical protein
VSDLRKQNELNVKGAIQRIRDTFLKPYLEL